MTLKSLNFLFATLLSTGTQPMVSASLAVQDVMYVLIHKFAQLAITSITLLTKAVLSPALLITICLVRSAYNARTPVPPVTRVPLPVRLV